MDFKTVAKLARFKDLTLVLLKYGFDDIVQRFHLPGSELLGKMQHTPHGLNTYERIRYALQDLGPTFVKFGQIMSLRPDFLPPPLIEELSKLQDQVAPVPFDGMRRVVEASVGRPLEEVFSILDPEPLAAGSLSQVHRGVLSREGLIVAVKIQRPGIRRKMETDLDIFETIAGLVHERSEELRAYDFPGMIREIRRSLLREINFTLEARNMKIARSHLADETGVYVPEVYEDHCSERLLVMEYIQGTKVREAAFDSIEDPQLLARQGLQAAIKQILVDGFFHADPHPGNVLITNDGRLCLLDWGMVGYLTESDRHDLADMLHHIVERDSRALMHTFIRISTLYGVVDQRGLERGLLEILETHYAVPLKDLKVGRLLIHIVSLLREHGLRIPSDLVLMIKALMTAEGTALEIYPAMNIFAEAEGQVRSLVMRRYNPEHLWQSLHSALSRFLALQHDFPESLVRVTKMMEKGELSVQFEHENLEGLMKTLDNSSNRLTFGVIIGALIIGSSMIITTGLGPLLFGFPALGLLGYLVSGLLGLWVVFSIIRSRKY